MAGATLATGSTLACAVLFAVTPAQASEAEAPASLRLPSATPVRASTVHARSSALGEEPVATRRTRADAPTSARIGYWTGRTLLVGGVAIGGLGASLLAIEPFADGTPFVGVGVGALAIGAVAAGIGLPLWLSNRTIVELHPSPVARGLSITGRF